MSSKFVQRYKRVLVYLVVLLVCYFFAWTAAFLFVNGGPNGEYFFKYLYLFWTAKGGEGAVFTGFFSLLFMIPITVVVFWIIFYRRKISSSGQ